jgi:DNA polymerase-4
VGEDVPARICCLDLDTFFVSVERLLDPALEGLPVVVGGRKGERGVVTAASYEVRAFGVRSGMSMADAVKLAPHAVFLPTRHGVYGPYAARVKEVLQRYTPIVQTASIDEFFLDFHGCEALWRQPQDRSEDATIVRTVTALRAAIASEIGLPASAGIGITRPIAKIASGQAKPAGTRFVQAGAELAFLHDLPVRRYPGIGPVAESKLVAAGITTLGQLVSLPSGPLRARFGSLASAVLRGADGTRVFRLGADRPAFREHDAPGSAQGSISNERTFRADLGAAEAEQQLLALVERVAWRARKRGVQARTLTVKLKYADFDVVSRGRSIRPTADESTLYGVARRLMKAAWERPLAVRLVGVALSNLAVPGAQLTLPFMADKPSPGTAVDAVRARFGYDAIRLGATGDKRSWVA